ncbi:glutaredoxin family protein [Domibacillus robiginosus]|uniref:glutaredoxin family protein n=1 Tax=Domibacillus robiginosus TaxID=1071054 RepID=UPI00067B37BB|nr:glutaredoxin family protein [Domibacillus robiginosus]
MIIYFYTRPGCHLCEDAQKVVSSIAQKWKVEMVERNIDTKDEWTEKYGLIIPAVEAGGELMAYGHVEYESLLAKLKQRVKE